MTSWLMTAIVAGLLYATLLITAGPAAAVNCGGGVTVRGGTPCWKAKRIVMEFRKTRRAHVQRFYCNGRSSGGRIVVVNCKLQNKRIHWEA